MAVEEATRGRVMVVGHLAGVEWFGGERSLIDLLVGFRHVGLDTVAVLPIGADPQYMEAIADLAADVMVLPVPPRSPRRPPDPAVVAAYRDAIETRRVDAVHTNTIVPREALIAARLAGVPAVVHAREIPGSDPALCRWLDADPDEPSLAAAMGEAGRQRAIERHSPARLSRALAATYRAVLPSAEVRTAQEHDMIVRLPIENHTAHAEHYFVSNRARFANTTGVRWIDERRLLTATLLGCRFDIVELDVESGTAVSISPTPTGDDRGRISVDLFDLRNGEVVTADCERSTVSRYRIDGRGIALLDSFPLPEPFGGYVHGASYVPGFPEVVVACTLTGRPAVLFLSTRDGSVLHAVEQPGWTPKSVAFTASGVMVVSSARRPLHHDPLEDHDLLVTAVQLGEDLRSHRITHTLLLPGLSSDGSTAEGDTVLIACQSLDALVVLDVGADGFVRRDDLVGFTFPHDAAVSPDGRWLAVANFGNSTVTIRPNPLR
jgi:hypothetical protein